MEFGGKNLSASFHSYHINATEMTPETDINLALPQPKPQSSIIAAAAAAAAAANPSFDHTPFIVREQDQFVPMANVVRIMRKILPPNTKISDDAKEMVQMCVSEYISFITGEANDRCRSEQRKTIAAEDLLWAMSKLGFDDYLEPLNLYLRRYREFSNGNHGSIRETGAGSTVHGSKDK